MNQAIISHIQRLMSQFASVNFGHTFKEANRCEDVLANIGCNSRQDFILMSHLLLDEDARGIPIASVICV